MPYGRFTPGSCGCDSAPTCAIGSANFAVDDLATAWTTTGTWAISGGVLTCTASGVALFNTAHPDGDSTMVVEVDLKHNTSSRRCSVLVAAVNASNYIEARYTIAGGSGSVGIYQVTTAFGAILLRQKTFLTINTGTFYAAKVCVSSAGVVSAALDDVVEVAVKPTVTLGTKCGLSATTSGTATFDNFVASKSAKSPSASSCEVCETAENDPDDCAECCSANPTNLIFHWPGGLTNQTCTQCSDFSAGDYTLTRTSNCTWQYCSAHSGACNDGRALTGLDSTRAHPCGIVASPNRWIQIDAITIVDTTTSPRECYVMVQVTVRSQTGSTTDHEQVSVTYMTATGIGTIDVCDGTEYDLEQHDEASQVDTYRDTSGWFDGYSGGCNGSLPATPTIRKA